MAVYSIEDETGLAKELQPSVMPLAEATKVIDFPSDARGKRTLDIGAGQSACTARLRIQGAEAYAIDPRYTDMAKLDEETSRAIEIARSRLSLHRGAAIGKRYYKLMQAARQAFKRDYRAHNRFYINAFAGDLPFDSNSFDFVFSINCITHGLDVDDVIFRRAIQEAYRVAKVRSEIQIYPFLLKSNERIRKYHERLLQEESLEYSVEAVPEFNSNRLRIRKHQQ
ncbi:MAG: class I SAM-dependent methyltransferase [Candidatus Aenigmarchaeota archaeon]|nr:class I SAM-dependent methyltransferase [Candidatus Aenigmarchaeota archaeon]